MEDSWANNHPERDAAGPVGSGLDLHVELAGPRVRASLETALRQAVQTGRLAAGTRLPASRTLAADLGVARNTVADVYGQLVAEGWLTARQGSATRVAEHPAAQPPAVAAPAATVPEPGEALRNSLKAGLPDLSEFPRTAWLAAARKAVTAAPSGAFGYGDPRGQPELRAALAAYLARARGVRAAADQIVICSGFTQGLSLLGRVLAGSGAAAVGVEAYGHRQHREVLEAAGLCALPVPVDPLGAVIGQVPDCAALLLTPAHQFPLGVALAPLRRNQAVAWAARTGALIIEDDYDGEFRYDRRAIGAMQALAPEHVIYAGTASKTLAPAVRLGWLVVPRRMLADVLSAKERADRHGSSLDELTLAEFITSGGYDRHVRRSRLRYQRRRGRLIAALARALPDPRITGVAAGMHAVLHLPPGVGEAEIVAAAAARGLALDGMRQYRMPGTDYPEALVVGYGTPPAHAFTTAVSRLCAVLSQVSRSAARESAEPQMARA
jgi:GntR family transcriptional regulator / MocR family aminotransferase